MKKQAVALLCAMMLTAAAVHDVSAEPAQRVDSIKVTVSSQHWIPTAVNDRMAHSVQTIAEQLLQDKKIEDVRENSESYEKIIHEVFDKVLVGYTVQRVHLSADYKSQLEIELTPWQDAIQEVNLEIAVEGMPPLIEKLARRDMDGINQVFDDTLKGLPLGAVDWSNGVLKRNVNSFMAEHLPEFRADFDVEADTATHVKMTVYPLLPVVRTMELRMRSDTVPNFTLLTLRNKLQTEANQLIGVPVAFVDRHRDELEKYYADMLDNTDGFRYFRMHTEVTLGNSSAMSLMSRSNAEKLRVRGESWTDLGHHHNGGKHSTRWRGRIGWMPTKRDDIYFIGEVYPRAHEWYVRTHAGYMYNVSGGFWAGAQYDIREQKWASELRYDFDKRWSLRHEYRDYDNESEFGVRYNLHDYLGMELVRDKDGTWLRVIGSF